MKNRNYNIYFHTHTVSGIVISVVLFIIFFAGSFSFFKDEITNWERNESVEITKNISFNIENALDTINKKYPLKGSNISIVKLNTQRRVNVSIEKPKDSLNSKKDKDSQFFYLDTKTFKTSTYDESYSLGEFIYRLHFLSQIPFGIGHYLSGLIALFFLFAIITGLLLHWKKIVANFYLFRPKEKLKIIWTDAHTSLGLIGLPFQFVYAVTGAFFMIKILILAPVLYALYGGDQSKLYQELEYVSEPYLYKNSTLKPPYHINKLVTEAKNKWNNFDITTVKIENYGDINMHLTIEGRLSTNQKLTGEGKIIYNIATQKIIKTKDPYIQNTYLDGVKNILFRIHFGDYGGYALKIISFILGIMTCIVIISGVKIWLIARDKNSIPENKRRFNRKVVHVYLAICLSMYPITAFTFIVSKLFYPLGQEGFYSVYFVGWLLLTIFFIIKRNDTFTNKYCLLLGSLLGVMVPITNGITTGNWFWITFINNNFQLFFIDAFWIVLAFISLCIALKLNAKPKKQLTIS